MNNAVPNALEQLAAAVRALLQLEALARANPGERHVVSELFLLLHPRFKKHKVANEYDRREEETKTLGKSKIIPDLIIHHPGDQTDNLLVVEC